MIEILQQRKILEQTWKKNYTGIGKSYGAGKSGQRENGWMDQIMDVG